MSNKAAVVGKAFNLSVQVAPEWTGERLVNLFCTPLEKQNYTQKEEKFLRKGRQVKLPFENSFVICHHFEGKGPSVILAHGWQANTGRWRALINQMVKEQYNVISIDAPAHGKSPGKQVNGVMYARVLSKAMEVFRPDYCIAHSFGGMAYAYYYATYENTIACKKLILMGVPESLKIILNQFISALSLSNNAIKSLHEAFYSRFHFDVETFDIVEILKLVKQNGLIIHDRKDVVAPFTGAEAMHQAWQESRIFATNGLGHSLQSAEVFRKILEEIKDPS